MKESRSVLITGGAGFIGSNLASLLLGRDYYVDCVDNLITGNMDSINPLRSNKFRFFKVDITSPEFHQACGEHHYDYIYHLACPTGVPNIKKLGEEMLRTCSVGTDNALRLALMHGSGLLYTSSAEVYGNPEVFPQEENYHGNVDPIGARSAYEEGKRFSEALLVHYVRTYGMNARIVRIFNAFGPGMSMTDQRVIPQFIKRIKQGEKVVIYGDGSQTRTLLYVDDLVEGLKLVMEEGAAGEVYNIGGTKQLSINELSELIGRLTPHKVDVEFQPHFIEDHIGREPAVSKVRGLGWEPRTDVLDGLKNMLALHGLLAEDRMTAPADLSEASRRRAASG
ncbi:MAG: NAD-dependent epimerase/dehydratase family protein [Gammaproteobacteria bacterium]